MRQPVLLFQNFAPRLSVRILLMVLTGLSWASQVPLVAQCERVAWVASSSSGCGPLLIDLDNGHILRAVSGADNLPGGKTVRFSSVPGYLPVGCSVSGTPVVVTCLSDTLPCFAKFGHAVSAQNAFRLNFTADVYDSKVQYCSWDFGDGSTAHGHDVQHTFAQEGYYPVCLTVTDAFGCSAQTCKEVFVSLQNPNWCGHDVVVTAVGTKLYGKVAPVSSSPGTLKSVKWFNNKTNAILAETPEFTTTLPGAGTYYICAQYEVEYPDGQTTCATTRCQVVTVAPADCVNTAMANSGAICPSFFAPVCGCNGVTYTNECAAMAAGITKWWSGECGAPTSGACGADLDIEVVDGSPAQGYTVRFRNLSSGYYSTVQIDFGDGSIWTGGPADSVVYHYYPSSGVYRTNLTVWKNNSCVSSVDVMLVTDTYSLIADKDPLPTDYVLPGDANGDKRANVYDLLHLGLGFAKTGAPRPFATTAWTPQFAPNWTQATNSGVNFKHIDCDGNGLVNEFDRNAIEQNYTPLDTFGGGVSAANAPKVWLRFAADSVIIDPNNPQPLQISADVMVGSPSKPAIGLYGLAFAVTYPEYVKHDPEVLYSTNSFFGFPTDILLLPKDIHSRRQFDLGFARKHGQPVSGFGSIAKINFATDFIIIIDVIERSGAARIPFVMPIHGLRAIDPLGNPIEMEGMVKDTLWLLIQETSTSTTPGMPKLQALLYPNPASDEAWIAVAGQVLEQVEVFDALGRLIELHQPTGVHTTRLDTHRWGKGIFNLRVRTQEGVVEKRLVVH